MPAYTHLLFDADNTLFDFHQASRIAFGKMMDEMDIPHDPEDYDLYHTVNLRVWQLFEKGQIDAVLLRSRRFQNFFDKKEIKADPHRANSSYLEHLASLPMMIPGAKELLADLNENYSLSIITNGLKEVQRTRIANAGLTDYFDSIVVSDEIGIAKPHPDYFDYAFANLALEDRKGAIVIGDSLTSDIKGAMNAGVDSCWFNPENLQLHSGISPTYSIQKLEELKMIF